MDNLRYYNTLRKVPAEAQKLIQGGRLKGFTDINPMWRIKSLTEAFGPAGFGWRFEVDKMWTEEVNGELLCFVNISLYVKAEDEWSAAIVGTGGSKLMTRETAGMYASDEGWKMATTDALSYACKNLGIGADIYWSGDRTKYTIPEEPVATAKPSVPLDTLASRKALLVKTVKETGGDEQALREAESVIASERLAEIKPLRNMTEQEFANYLKQVKLVIERTKKP